MTLYQNTMSRSKRSHHEVKAVDEQPRREVAEVNQSDTSASDNELLNTPTKKTRLNLTGSAESAVVEETATAYLASERQQQTLVTPARQGRKTRSKDTNKSATGDIATEEVDRARRSLFTPPDARPSLVTPSKSSLSEVASPAKRRLMFGRYVKEITVQENVKKVYNIVKKLTGSTGGNASGGPIYGELTMGSMQKMVNVMKEHTEFNKHSKFIDVGSGIGKPNLHVAQDPGVDISYGLEVDGDRWLLSMNCLRGVLGQATRASDIKHRCVFIQGDIKSAHTFDPFTHVYMFSIGFPPELWLHLSEMWNRSQSPYLICYHSPKDIIQNYEFEAELITQLPTSMHGSKEGHTGYIYKRTKSKGKKNRPSALTQTDPLFAEGIDYIGLGLRGLNEWVTTTLEKKMTLGPSSRTRTSKKKLVL